MLSRPGRILTGLAAFALIPMFALPLWNVTLQAPQYPEGLGMRIWLDTITGIKPNDLNNINNLNHYIGMKRIEPDAIAELRYMPFIVGGLIVLAGLAATRGRRWLLNTWIAAFIALSAIGLADFYRWEYDYGHDLDMENAIIKVPGMNYQPPLIGSKQLLNFRATSLPASGAIFAFVAFGFGVAALVVERRARVRRTAARFIEAPTAA
jgi:hypothetical protein